MGVIFGVTVPYNNIAPLYVGASYEESAKG